MCCTAGWPALLSDISSSLMYWCHQWHKGGGGGNALRPYSQQTPMRTNLSCCPGLTDNGSYKSTNRLLVLVPHERPHGIMRILKNLCMLPPKALKMKMRAIKDTAALIADSIGGTKCALAEMSWHLRHLNPALLNRQGMSIHLKMQNGSELCHWKGQLIVGLCVDPVRPQKHKINQGWPACRSSLWHQFWLIIMAWGLNLAITCYHLPFNLNLEVAGKRNFTTGGEA